MEGPSARINADGSTSLTIDIGGIATEIVSCTLDKIVVRNAKGAVYSRTIGIGPWTLDSTPPAPAPVVEPPKEVVVAWVKLFEEDATSNAFDSYVGAEGSAQVWRNGDNLDGYINGGRFSIKRPPEGNVQALRIYPDRDGWYVHSFNDPRDGRRALWREKVAAR